MARSTSNLSALVSFVKSHQFRYRIDHRAGTVSVGIPLRDADTGELFTSWETARTISELREIVGY